ncbi:5'/3'-nucleotidase SurE [Acidobacteria bacterium AH-259-D05]|nr:5'/3'-nucleotidase SurE [Acidobacteria bacterium AH-259-D05]
MMQNQDWLILLTNDDGVEAEGLLALKSELSKLGTVVVVAPDRERSAVGHGLTIHHPIRTVEVSQNHYALSGTPADCVIFALQKLLPREPDLVVSGINHGPNLGNDVIYSGTVAGAREAAIHHLPALSVSAVLGKKRRFDFIQAAELVRWLIDKLFPLPRGTFLNVNIPPGNPVICRFTRQGSQIPAGTIEEKQDPRGRRYYWIGRDESKWMIEADTDFEAVGEGVVSVTPLQRDHTDYHSLSYFNGQRRQFSIKKKLRSLEIKVDSPMKRT